MATDGSGVTIASSSSLHGEIYWAKSGNYPFWPCVVLDEKLLIAKWRKLSDRGKKRVVVFFGGDCKFAGVALDKLRTWGEDEPHHAEVGASILIGIERLVVDQR